VSALGAVLALCRADRVHAAQVVHGLRGAGTVCAVRGSVGLCGAQARGAPSAKPDGDCTPSTASACSPSRVRAPV
jgi:hypothetical protein